MGDLGVNRRNILELITKNYGENVKWINLTGDRLR